MLLVIILIYYCLLREGLVISASTTFLYIDPSVNIFILLQDFPFPASHYLDLKTVSTTGYSWTYTLTTSDKLSGFAMSLESFLQAVYPLKLRTIEYDDNKTQPNLICWGHSVVMWQTSAKRHRSISIGDTFQCFAAGYENINNESMWINVSALVAYRGS